MTPAEYQEMTEVLPPLLRIFRSVGAGDVSAKEAWHFLRGNITVFDRANHIALERKARHPGEPQHHEVPKPKRKTATG